MLETSTGAAGRGAHRSFPAGTAPVRASQAPRGDTARRIRAGFALLFATLALLMLVPTSGLARAADPFAALTVTAHGRQQYDIATGVTVMPDGGTITDLTTGVSLVAAHVEYLAGSYVKARLATVDGDFGRVSAAQLHVDLKAGVLEASGDLSLARDGMTVTAASLRYDSRSQVAVFTGGVHATDPAFQADRLLLDVISGDVLLDGRYVFQGDLFTMTSPEGGGQLELRYVMAEGGPTYDAATEVRPELLKRFEGYL